MELLQQEKKDSPDFESKGGSNISVGLKLKWNRNYT